MLSGSIFESAALRCIECMQMFVVSPLQNTLILIDPNRMQKNFNPINFCHDKMFTVEDKMLLALYYIVITKYSCFIITMSKFIYSIFFISKLLTLSFYCL